jgi:3-hydroxyisobutyrate dehydrogenase-like beta-hydroxyacid dehydrogenase
MGAAPEDTGRAMTRFALFGLGEAGSEIGRDLAALGAAVNGFDPADVATPVGVVRADTPTDAVRGADVVLAVTSAADAPEALKQAIDAIPTNALYADLGTAAPGLKRSLAATAGEAGLRFVDVALMSTVPGKGIRTPALAAGAAAIELVGIVAHYGMPMEIAGPEPGDAATRKLLRSIVLKGMAGVLIESLRAARAAGLADETWHNVVGQLVDLDEAFVRRLVEGTGPHARRRKAEMEATAIMLDELGVESVMTRATIEKLATVLADGVPELP